MGQTLVLAGWAWGGSGGGGARKEQERTALLCVSPGVFITTVLGLSMSPLLHETTDRQVCGKLLETLLSPCPWWLPSLWWDGA